MAERSEPCRPPRVEAKTSRLRSVAGSRRRVRELRCSWIARRFSGFAQRFAVA
jgi:hypothetical protein